MPVKCFQLCTTTFRSDTIRVFLSNTIETIGVPKPSFAKSVFDAEHKVGTAEWYLLVRIQQKLILSMTHLLKKFFSQGETILDFCMGTELTLKSESFSPETLQVIRVQSRRFMSLQRNDSCFRIVCEPSAQRLSDINEMDGIREVV